MKGSAPLEAPTNVCPRCGGRLIKAQNGDRECLQCGYIAYARPPRHRPTKRERRPSHKGIYL